MSRFFVPHGAVNGKIINVSGQEAHHIVDVMRLKVSDSVVTFDGTGKEYAGFIKEISKNSIIIEVTQVRQPGPKDPRKFALIQALTKKDKMDYIVEKATELGVSVVRVVTTDRTIPVWDDAKSVAHVERWQKIAREAAKQCGRADIPKILEITRFTEAVKDFDAYGIRLIAVLEEETVSLKNALPENRSGDVVIAIGPEGDFTSEESAAAKGLGFKAISLGRLVLKSDTAGLAALAILNHELSN